MACILGLCFSLINSLIFIEFLAEITSILLNREISTIRAGAGHRGGPAIVWIKNEIKLFYFLNYLILSERPRQWNSGGSNTHYLTLTKYVGISFIQQPVSPISTGSKEVWVSPLVASGTGACGSVLGCPTPEGHYDIRFKWRRRLD